MSHISHLHLSWLPFGRACVQKVIKNTNLAHPKRSIFSSWLDSLHRLHIIKSILWGRELHLLWRKRMWRDSDTQFQGCMNQQIIVKQNSRVLAVETILIMVPFSVVILANLSNFLECLAHTSQVTGTNSSSSVYRERWLFCSEATCFRPFTCMTFVPADSCRCRRIPCFDSNKAVCIWVSSVRILDCRCHLLPWDNCVRGVIFLMHHVLWFPLMHKAFECPVTDQPMPCTEDCKS